MISCNKRNLGCNGGSTAIGAKYAAENWFGGVATLKDYPYTDIDGVATENCLLNKQTMPAPAVEVKDPKMESPQPWVSHTSGPLLPIQPAAVLSYTLSC